MNYKEEKKFFYDMDRYGFAETIQDLLEVNDLSMTHELAQKDYEFFSSLGQGEDDTEFHKIVYGKLRSGWPEFLNAYKRFIKDEVSPNFKTDMGLIYQKWPTFRFHLPNNVAVGAWHTDGSYNHPPNEINFIVALTSMYESNATIIESEPGKKDFHQLECEPGEYIRFNGNECLHGNLPNKTGKTRISFDFRVMRLEDYDPSSGKSSITMNKKYLIGHYYEKLD